MRPIRLPDLPDLLPGRYDAAMAVVLAAAAWYVHHKRYEEPAIMKAGTFVATAFAMSKAGESRGFDRGYNTYNPDLHRDDPPAAPREVVITPPLPLQQVVPPLAPVEPLITRDAPPVRPVAPDLDVAPPHQQEPDATDLEERMARNARRIPKEHRA